MQLWHDIWTGAPDGPVSPLMFVYLVNGGMLELFRLFGRSEWTRAAAAELVRRFGREARLLRELRRMLYVRRPGVISALSDDEVLQSAADLIATGSLAPVKDNGAARWRGVAASFGGRNGVMLVWRHGVDGVSDARQSVALLELIDKEASQLQELEGLLSEPAVHRQDAVSHGDLLQQLERAINDGRILAVYYRAHRQTLATPEESHPAPSVGGRPRGGPDPEPEPATFGTAHSAAAQADSLRSASRFGVPFCEMCERASQAANR